MVGLMSHGYLVELVLSSDRSVAVRPATFSAGFMEDMLLKGGRVSRTYDVTPGPSLMVWDPTTAQEDDLQIPNDTPSGNYFICAVVDPSGTLDEEDESNNVDCAAITIDGVDPSVPPTPLRPPPRPLSQLQRPQRHPPRLLSRLQFPQQFPQRHPPRPLSRLQFPQRHPPRPLSRLQHPQRHPPRPLSRLQRPQRQLPRPLSRLQRPQRQLPRPPPQAPNRHLSPPLRPHPYAYPSSQTPLPS